MKLLILVFTVSIISYIQHPHKVVKHQSTIDTSRYAILKFKKDGYPNFDKNAEGTIVSADELEKIDALINRAVVNYNKKTTGLEEKIRNAASYYKQVIAVVNSKGEKEVWVNCFCDEGSKSSMKKLIVSWKKDILLVSDGGSCYFNLKINLTKNTVYNFMVNGEA